MIADDVAPDPFAAPPGHNAAHPKDAASIALVAMIKAMRLTGAIDLCVTKRIAEHVDAAALEPGLNAETVRELRALAGTVRRLCQRSWSVSAASP